jgi:hypothetical protein
MRLRCKLFVNSTQKKRRHRSKRKALGLTALRPAIIYYVPLLMRSVLVIGIFVAWMTISLADEARPRSIRESPEARAALARGVSPGFYKSLLISSIEGWITVRGQLSGDHLLGTRVAHSELNGEFDSLALELANNLHIQAYNQTATLSAVRTVLVHVLVYQGADGKLVISFANFEEAGGTQLKYTGAAWMAVLKRNHLWVTIEPRELAPHERRGPRTYTIAVEAPGNTKLPRAIGAPLLRSR